MTIERKDQLDVSVSAAVYIMDEEGRLLLLKQAAPEKGLDREPGGDPVLDFGRVVYAVVPVHAQDSVEER